MALLLPTWTRAVLARYSELVFTIGGFWDLEKEMHREVPLKNDMSVTLLGSLTN
jgi:hypothetical protein